MAKRPKSKVDDPLLAAMRASAPEGGPVPVYASDALAASDASAAVPIQVQVPAVASGSGGRGGKGGRGKAAPPPRPPRTGGVIPTELATELRGSYGDYAMSVIVSRALPDVRDGLKPVHRRILWSMEEGGCLHDRPYRKSARVVGDVMGKYHPHGDTAIYDAMVRLAQSFSMSVRLIDGQGNFGSVDGDPAAAMRYTESRLAFPARLLLDDVDRDVVDFKPNYDGAFREPTALPARFPNILVNGSEGIAVGIATKIPPHDMGEVVRACLALLEDAGLSDARLLELIPGPDFPTGGLISGSAGLASMALTGKGACVITAVHSVEEARRGRKALVFTEIPFQVNKTRLAETIHDLMRRKRLPGVAEVRDESDRDGMRFVVEIEPDADPDRTARLLFRQTELRVGFSAQMYALHQGRPRLMGYREILGAFLDFRRQVVRRRTVFDLRKARDRAHLLLGRLLAVSVIDKIVATIRSSADAKEALARLMDMRIPRSGVSELYALLGGQPGFKADATSVRLTELQARDILELRLQRLTGLERGRLEDEGREVATAIARYLSILRDAEILKGIVRTELEEVLSLVPSSRRSRIVPDEVVSAEKEEEVVVPFADPSIPDRPCRVELSFDGRIRRVMLGGRRGKGEEDAVETSSSIPWWSSELSLRDALLVFTASGGCFRLDVSSLPDDSQGKAMQSLIPIGSDPIVGMVSQVAGAAASDFLLFVTSKAEVRRNPSSAFARIPKEGRPAMRFPDGSGTTLLSVLRVAEEDTVVLATANGQVLRFEVSDVRSFAGTDSTGVRAMRVAEDDSLRWAIVGGPSCGTQEELAAYSGDSSVPPISAERRADLAASERFLAQVTDAGLCKRTSLHAIRVTGRGGQGVRDVSTAKKAGRLLGVFSSEARIVFGDVGSERVLDVSSMPVLPRAATGAPLPKGFSVSGGVKGSL